MKSFSIIIAGGLIAAAILYVFHWEIVGGSAAQPDVFRLNRWNGDVVYCHTSSQAAPEVATSCIHDD